VARIVSLFEDRSGFARQVEEELRAMQESSAKNTMRSLLIVIASLALFVSFQLVSTSLSGVLMLILVLFVHECGHLIAMKLSGYRDVQMFFIPFFGAAVSGVETAPNGTRRALVALSGPIPGIALGLVSTMLFHATGAAVFGESARTFLLLNTFNLLPFMPLDGGHFMDAVIFSRHPILKAAFSLVAGVALAVLAWTATSVVFGLLAFFILWTVRLTYASSQLARDLKEELARAGGTSTTLASGDEPVRMPAEYIERLLPFLELYIPEAQRTPQLVAVAVHNIWNMVWSRPPSLAASIGLLIAYVACFSIGVMATLSAEILFRPT
jgi:Zn-dependent protease